MSHLAKLTADNLAKTIACYIVNGNGIWRQLAIASDEMREWDNGCGRHLVYSDVLDVCSYLDITVTARKIRRDSDYNSLLTIQVNNGEETYKAEIAFRGIVTLEEAKAILEGK